MRGANAPRIRVPTLQGSYKPATRKKNPRKTVRVDRLGFFGQRGLQSRIYRNTRVPNGMK